MHGYLLQVDSSGGKNVTDNEDIQMTFTITFSKIDGMLAKSQYSSWTRWLHTPHDDK